MSEKRIAESNRISPAVGFEHEAGIALDSENTGAMNMTEV